MPEDENQYHVLTDSGVYKEHPYKNEQELERLVVAHAEDVFGKSTLYFGVKQKVASKLHARVTDGLFLDFTKKPIPYLWVVEYELDSHDLERHVIPQLRGFVKAFANEETTATLRSSIYDEINASAEKLRRFQELAGEKAEVYFTLDKALHGDATILVVYDRLPENLEKRLDEADFDYDARFIEFRTFENKGKLAHYFNPLRSSGVAKPVGEIMPDEKKAEKVNRLDRVKQILREKGALSYADIVKMLPGDIALIPAIKDGSIIRQKVGGHFLYALPGTRFPEGRPIRKEANSG